MVKLKTPIIGESKMSSEVKAGTAAVVKVGKNEVEVTILEIFDNEWLVKSVKSGKSFRVKKLERIIPTPEMPKKKLSLINAACEVLQASGEPLNTREMVERSISAGLWEPTSCKTPEQTLYGSIFREIKEKENPRFRKSTVRKGAFEAVR